VVDVGDEVGIELGQKLLEEDVLADFDRNSTPVPSTTSRCFSTGPALRSRGNG